MSQRLFEWCPTPTSVIDLKLLSNPRTDVGNGQAFAYLHGREFRWVEESKKWFYYNGVRWVPNDGYARKCMIHTIRSIGLSALQTYPPGSEMARGVMRWATECESTNRLNNAMNEAKIHLTGSISHFDREEFLFACANAIIDLRTGLEVSPLPEHYIRRMSFVRYNPEAECPRWEKFLQEVFQGNTDLINFVHRAVGYTLTASTIEQCFFVLYGHGENGKSKMVDTLLELFGEYGITANSSLLLDTHGGIPNDVARVDGARLVKASETKEDTRFDIERVKALTGERHIVGRFLYAEEFEFKPICKMWMTVNHLPEITDTTASIWRRIFLIPFNASFPRGSPQRDDYLEQKLFAELPGILNWAIGGYIQYQKYGLAPPEDITVVTKEYEKESDPLGMFMQSEAILGPKDYTCMEKAKDVIERFKRFCQRNGFSEMPIQAFGRRMREKGIEKRHHGLSRDLFYFGIRLKEEDE